MGGIPAADGKKIKYGKLIRSGRLCKLPAETVQTLKDMKLDNIIDMRTPKERETRPSTIIEGVEYHNLPLVATATEEIMTGKSMTSIVFKQSKRIKKDFPDYESYIHAMYDILAFSPSSVAVLKEVFRLLLAEENCILWHCNSGTDRTGIVAMLLETALGVEKDVIMEDYMASFRFQRRRRYLQRTALVIVPMFKLKGLLHAMMFIKPRYLLRLMEEMEKRYGSVLGYIRTELGVTDEQISLLREKYLE